MIKVVHISTASTGGAGVAAYRLHCGLTRQSGISSYFVQQFNNNEQNDINTVTAYPKLTYSYRIMKKLGLRSEIRNRKKILKYPINYEIATLPTSPYRLEELSIIQEADIIHLHWVADFLNYPTFFKNIQQPIVWTLHDMNPFMGIFHYEGDVNRNKDLETLNNTIARQKRKWIHQNQNLQIVCPSRWLEKKSLISETFKRYPHTMIPNGLDLSAYPYINKDEAKQALNINNGLKTIMFIAHSLSISRKGFHLLSASIDRLKSQQFNLISVGGEKIDIPHKGVNHIHYNSIHDETLINTIYSASDLMVLPTKEDNLPNVMLESFANGIPVLSFANGGMAEHIRTGENGILVNEVSIDALTKNLYDFLNNKYTFNQEKIRQYATDNFSDKLQAERYINLYKEILNK